jgi:phosphatidylinositol 4-kinase B
MPQASAAQAAMCATLRQLAEAEAIAALQALWCAGYEAAVKHAEKVVQLVDMMRMSGCPCFVGGSRCLDGLRRRLRAGRSTIERLVTDSADAWSTRQYDYYQRVANGIL